VTPAPEASVHSEAHLAEGTTQQTVAAPPRIADDPPPVPSAWSTYPSVRIAAAILCMAIAALAIWLVFLRSSGSETATPGGGPVGASPQDLAALSKRLGQSIYWAGTRSGTQLEATVTTNEYVYVRYLANGAPVGDPSPEFLTVATYPAVDAFGNLRSYANHANAKTTHVSGGGIAVPVPGAATSVYFATPDSDYQVEVYDPDEGAALALIKSGAIVPVPGGVDPSVPPAR
jgi:hypothetical protein